uniref:Apolipoprotein M n=1 Tax=Labrus bergylta TaxID=56723 RepID=A0A3Q3E6M1_9LABR
MWTLLSMLAVCTLALLSLVSAIPSASLECKDLIRPPKSSDPRDFEGKWAMVADSLKSPNPMTLSRSIVIDVYNSTFYRGSLIGPRCVYDSHKITVEALNYKTEANQHFNISGSIFHTSCPDCMSPHYSTVNFYLMSRSREVGQAEMDEFRAQVECLKMPPPVVMDPTKELCPEEAASTPAEEEREGQNA